MSDESMEFSERTPKSKPSAKVNHMTLERAIELGEYDEKFLETFRDWADLSQNIRFNYILRAIKNRRQFLRLNYAETFNVLDYSQKPELKNVLEAINKRLIELQLEEEKIRVEYSSRL
ncbi:MAG: hypothetical protein WAV41_06030 [Microgenomates group bacterium]